MGDQGQKRVLREASWLIVSSSVSNTTSHILHRNSDRLLSNGMSLLSILYPDSLELDGIIRADSGQDQEPAYWSIYIRYITAALPVQNSDR